MSLNGGFGAQAGRLIVSNAATAPVFGGVNLAATLETFEGLLAENPHLPELLQSPYIKALRSGPEVAGLLNGINAADFDHEDLRGGSRRMAVRRMAASSFPGLAEGFSEYDFLFLINLTRDPLEEPVLGAGNSTYYHRLIDGGLAGNPQFGGNGSALLENLGDSEVYVTLAPKPVLPETGIPVCFGFRRGLNMEIEVASLPENGVAFLEIPGSPNYGEPGSEYAAIEPVAVPVVSLPSLGPALVDSVGGELGLRIVDPLGEPVPGALWSLEGDGRFFGSGVVGKGLPLGNQKLVFQSLPGWITPTSLTHQVLPAAPEELPVVVYTPAPKYELTLAVGETEVGGIAPQVVGEDRILGFWIGTWSEVVDEEDGTTERVFEVDASASLESVPAELGSRISLVDGWFSYAPDSSDGDDFEVEIRSIGQTQSVSILPRPELPLEERVINLKFSRPDAALPPSNQAGFRRVVDADGRRVISGIEIVLDDFTNFIGLDPMSSINVYGDKVIVDKSLDLAGASLIIHARELCFINPDSSIGGCGNVELNVLSLVAPRSETARFVLGTGSDFDSPFPEEAMSRITDLDGGSIRVADPSGLPLGYRWMHPMAMRHLLDYADQLYYLGFYEETRDLLDEYLGWIRGIEAEGYDRVETMEPVLDEEGQPVLDENDNAVVTTKVELTANGTVSDLPDAKGGRILVRDESGGEVLESEDFKDATLLAFSQLAMEMESLRGRLVDNLDYFGNPLGWVPMLSFESLYTLAEGEVERSMDTLYLTYWLGNKAASLETTRDALIHTRGQLQAENDRLNVRFAEFVGEQESLQNEAKLLDSRIKEINGDLVLAEANLVGKAEEVVEERGFVPAWKQGARVLGGIAQMVPVYQPALLAAGRSLDLLTRLDEQEPIDNLLSAVNIAAEYGGNYYDQQAQLLEDSLKPPLEGDALEAQNLRTSAENVRSAASGLNIGVEKVQSFLAEKEYPETEIGVELERLRAGDPQLASLVARLVRANEDKVGFALRLAQIESELAEIPGVIQGNLLAMRSMKEAEDAAVAVLSPGAISHLQSMERRAKSRLRQYFYWMAKAYEYRFLDSYGRVPGESEAAPTDLDATFAALQELGEAAESEGDEPYIMSEAQFTSLGEVFDDELSNLANDVITRITSGGGIEVGGRVTIDLSAEKLAELNQKDRSHCFLNLFEENYLGEDWEQARITDLRVVAMEYEAIGTPTGTATLQTYHGLGSSLDERPSPVRISKAGEVYVFRPRNASQQPRSWISVLTVDGVELNSIEHTRPSVAGDALFQTMLGTSPTTPLFLRPAAWTDLKLVLSRTSDTIGRLTRVTLEVDVDYTQKLTADSEVMVRILDADNLDSTSTSLSIHQAPPLKPRIEVSNIDENGRKDGFGPIIRRYESGISVADTSFTAERQFGLWEFVEWRRLNQGGWEVFTDGGWTSDPAPEAVRPLSAIVEHSGLLRHLRIFAVYRDLGDRSPATVESIVLDTSTSNEEFSEFVVRFSEEVVGVDEADFSAAERVTGSGRVRRVRVATGEVTSFALADNDSILDLGSNSLGGSGSDDESDGSSAYDNSSTTTSPPAGIASLARDRDGRVTLSIVGGEGAAYVLEWSDDMNGWSPLETVVPGTDAVDHSGTASRRFYRLSGTP